MRVRERVDRRDPGRGVMLWEGRRRTLGRVSVKSVVCVFYLDPNSHPGEHSLNDYCK